MAGRGCRQSGRGFDPPRHVAVPDVPALAAAVHLFDEYDPRYTAAAHKALEAAAQAGCVLEVNPSSVYRGFREDYFPSPAILKENGQSTELADQVMSTYLSLIHIYTGNEGWVYNDNVNDPKIKKWLGEVVGKEGEDLTRHDKWLCMMYPRLKLLQKLLADDGVIFISIDDREQVLLRMICNEIFGENNFLAQFVWQKRTSPDMRKLVSTAHEYVCAYCKDISYLPNAISKVALSEEDAENYKNPDNDPRGPWASSDFTAQGFRPNQMYEIITPGGARYTPPEGRCWKNVESEFIKQRDEGRMWFGADGKGIPRRKTYLSEREGKNVWTWWDNKGVGHSQEATKEIGKIFGTPTAFDYPKPVRLIQRIIQIATRKDSIVLDSFAGSGTTAQAVLNMNKHDGGCRRIILVEMGDYADSITAERVKRVINGYGEGKNAVAGTGGNFSFYDLGEPLLVGDCLNEAVAPEKIREYIWFMETKQPYAPPIGDNPYYLGKHNLSLIHIWSLSCSHRFCEW